MTYWNVIIDHDIMLCVINGDREIPYSPFVDDGRAQGILHCLPCLLAQEFCVKETEQQVDKAHRPSTA